jgi:hypothetical protein
MSFIDLPEDIINRILNCLNLFELFPIIFVCKIINKLTNFYFNKDVIFENEFNNANLKEYVPEYDWPEKNLTSSKFLIFWHLNRYLVKNGHLDLLKWVKAYGFDNYKFTENVCSVAISHNYFEILEWLKENINYKMENNTKNI